MKNKAYDLSCYSFSANEQILVDANIWLYLFPAPSDPNTPFAQQYSAAFAKLIGAKAQPILDALVLSEYLNKYIRIEWKGKYNRNYHNFKQFRKSHDFLPIASTAKKFAQQILYCCKIHSTAASDLDLSQALTDFSTGGVDFNDGILMDICKKNNFKLMTNDGDFQAGGIEVLTTNRKLLTACP